MRIFTSPHPQTLYNIGAIYADNSANNDQGDDVKTFEYFRRAITFCQSEKLYKRHPRYRQTFGLFIRSLSIQETILRRNHPATLRTRVALIRLKIEPIKH